MTTNNVFTPEVLADILDRVERVQSYLKQSTDAWLSIASEFVTAKQTLKTIVYERFVNDAGFTKNVAEKLLKIGSLKTFYDPKIQTYLVNADGWTVLYELAKLDQSKIEEVFDVVKNENKKLTRDLVMNVAQNRPIDEKTIVLASIEVTSSRLANITQIQSDQINQKLREIEQIISSQSSVVAFKKRDKSLQKIAESAAANSNVALVTTQVAA